jgi:hypothetical protein
MFSADQITSSYVSAGGSGTLTVSSGGQVVAGIEFAGSYSAGNFHISSGIGGTVKITDPGVVDGGSVQFGTARPSRSTASICRTSRSARRRRSPMRRTEARSAAR